MYGMVFSSRLYMPVARATFFFSPIGFVQEVSKPLRVTWPSYCVNSIVHGCWKSVIIGERQPVSPSIYLLCLCKAIPFWAWASWCMNYKKVWYEVEGLNSEWKWRAASVFTVPNLLKADKSALQSSQRYSNITKFKWVSSITTLCSNIWYISAVVISDCA